MESALRKPDIFAGRILPPFILHQDLGGAAKRGDNRARMCRGTIFGGYFRHIIGEKRRPVRRRVASLQIMGIIKQS